MICKNCGANFNDDLPKCPYCGEFNYSGAEKEYFHRLHGMKEDLHSLEDQVPKMYTGELKEQTNHVKKIFLIVLGILLLLILLFFGIHRLLDSMIYGDPKTELLFAKEAFPVAEEYYETGDYEGLLQFYRTSMEENKNANFYNWDHYAFLICYENYQIFSACAVTLGTDDFAEGDLQELLYCYISNRFYQKGYPMSEQDLLLVTSLEDEMETVLSSLSLTAEEEKTLNDFLNDPDYPSWEDIESFSQKVYKRLF